MEAQRQPKLVAKIAPSITIYQLLRTHLRDVESAGFEILCVCDDDEWGQRLRDLGYRVAPVGMGRRPSPLAVLVWAMRLYRVLLRERPQVIHTTNAFHGLGARAIGRVARVPVIAHTVHNWFYLQPGERGSVLFRFLERVGARLGDVVFFVGTDDFEEAREKRIVSPSRSEYIGDGIDVEGFSAACEASNPREVRHAAGLGQDDIVVTMIARAERPKNHRLFLEAFERVAAHEPRVQALLIGGGAGLPALERLVAASACAGRVHLLGNRDDVAQLLSATDVLVLASAYEAFGRSVVEGMVARVPVIGTNVKGLRHIIEHRRTGLLVEDGDVEALAQAIVDLIHDRELTRRLVAAAHTRALELFDERDVSARVCEAYERLLSRKDGRRSRGRPDEGHAARVAA